MRKLLHSEILEERLSPEASLSSVRHPVSLILHNIRSLYNVGSIFRTADSAMAHELVLTGYTPHPPRAEIEKTALGAVDSVPWSYFANINDAIDKAKQEGRKVFALELTDRKRRYDSLIASDYPLSIILGNELTGLDDEILALCDDAIEIPMYGVKHSLNVSVAAGISLYEAIRCWHSNNKNT